MIQPVAAGSPGCDGFFILGEDGWQAEIMASADENAASAE